MGDLSAALKAALVPGAGVRFVTEVDFIDGASKWSKVGVNSEEAGAYEQRVSKYGPVTWKLSSYSGSVFVPESSFTIDDSDRSFDRRVTAGERLRGIAVRHYLAAVGVPYASWFQYFSGVLMDWDRDSDRMEYTLKLRYDDAFLSRPFPQITIDPGDWPNAPRDNWGKSAPVVVGVHDSSGFGTRKGAAECILVDSVNNGWLISYGRCMSVDRYFDGDTQITSGITLTLDYEVNGRHWTYVQFSSAKSSLRVDCHGIDSIGDGTGTLIEADTDVLLFALCNFIFASNQTGNAWSFSSDRVAWTLAASVDRISARFDGSETAYSYITRWLTDRPDTKILWQHDGKLAFVADVIVRAPYSTFPYDILLPPDVDKVQPSWPRENPVGRIFATLGPGKERLEVADALDPEPVVDTLDLSAGPDFV
jgi:hypothetical protein